MAAGFRISQSTPGVGVTDRSRFDLVAGETITLTAVDPAPGDGITYQWEMIDRAGTSTGFSEVSGNTAYIDAQAEAPFAFLVELRVYTNSTLTGVVRREFGARTPSKGLRLPLFAETADPSARLAARNIPGSTDNAVYADRAGTGVSEQNWRGWTEFLHEVVLAVEDAGDGGGGGGGAIGKTIVVGPFGPGSVTDLEIPNVKTVRVVVAQFDDNTILESILPPPHEGDPVPADWHSVIFVNFTQYPLTLKANGAGSYGSTFGTKDGEDYMLAPYQGVLLVYLHFVAAWTVHELGSPGGGGGGGGSGDVEGPGSATAGSLAAFTDGTHIVEAGLGVASGNLVLAGGKTVDGRDVSVDGAKLDTIESNAQVTSLARINTATGRSAAVDGTKLDGIETGAQTTSAARVLTALAAAAGDVSINSHKLTNVQDPTSAQQAATKAYVDNTLVTLTAVGAQYKGGLYTPSELRYVSNAWTGVISSVFTGTWSDEVQNNITRSGENFTVTKAGLYSIEAYFPSFASSTPPLHALRMLVNGVQSSLSQLDYGGSNNGSTSDHALRGFISLAVNDVLAFEYINVTGATVFGGFSNNQMGGANIKSARIEMALIGGAVGPRGLPGAGGWQKACDLNFTQMANQTIVDGANTLDGKTWTAANVATASSIFRILNGSGLQIKVNTFNSAWYYSGFTCPYIDIGLDGLLPVDWQWGVSELRVSAQFETTSASPANYDLGGVSIERRSYTMNQAWTHKMYAGYTPSYVRYWQILMESAEGGVQAAPTTYQVDQLHLRGDDYAAYYHRNTVAADVAPNDDVFAQNDWVQLGMWKPSSAITYTAVAAMASARVRQNSEACIRIACQSGNANGNAFLTMKRLRIEYKL